MEREIERERAREREYISASMWSPEDNLIESVISFHHVVPAIELRPEGQKIQGQVPLPSDLLTILVRPCILMTFLQSEV